MIYFVVYIKNMARVRVYGCMLLQALCIMVIYCLDIINIIIVLLSNNDLLISLTLNDSFGIKVVTILNKAEEISTLASIGATKPE